MGWLQKLVYGVDLDEEQRRQEELDAALAELNRKKLESGSWDQSTYDLASKQLEGSSIDVNAQVSEAFALGAAEGAATMRGSVSNAINKTVGTVTSIIPWQIWLVLLAMGAFYAVSTYRVFKR